MKKKNRLGNLRGEKEKDRGTSWENENVILFGKRRS